MVRVRERLTVLSVRRDWFERYVSALHDEFESMIVQVGGLLPEPGSQHSFEQEELTVASWDRAVETRLVSDEVTLTLRSADRPVFAGFHGTMSSDGHVLDMRAEADLARWWAQAAGRKRGRAPLAASLRHHRYGRAEVKIGCVGAAERTWDVLVTLDLRGRGWLRPVVAAGVLIFGRRAIKRGCLQAGRDWDRHIAEYTAGDPALAAQRSVQATLEEGALSREWETRFGGGDDAH